MSTFANPTIDFVIPLTVPVNVGEAIGAYVEEAVDESSLFPRAVVIVDA